MKRVGIVGGGLGGLASACVLAARRYEVVLCECNDWLGGKAAVSKGRISLRHGSDDFDAARRPGADLP